MSDIRIQKYKNPIISGYNPDPSICRVGDDFYLVNSTFEFYPGVPVYHSKNLVNWELINYCLRDKEQLIWTVFGRQAEFMRRCSVTITVSFL